MPPIAKWRQMSKVMVVGFWGRHDKTVLRLAIFLMSFVALIWLGYEFWRLLFQTAPMGALDLVQRQHEVQDWFAGKPIYRTRGTAVYPPASYLILWSHLGWLGTTAARWLWAVSSLGMLAWLVWLSVRECGAKTRLMVAFTALIPLSIYPTGATIGNGQLPVHILPLLVAGLTLLRQEPGNWRKDLLAATLFLIALIKPSMAAPFFWLVLLAPGRLRPAVFVVLGYVGLTCLASVFQQHDPVQLLYDWQVLARAGVDWGAQRGGGHNNLAGWLNLQGMLPGNTVFSFILLMALGLWTYFHRRAELWILIGVAALVTRFLTYHRWYDDLLILLPLIALFRTAKQSIASSDQRFIAAILFALTLVFMIAPGGLYLLPPPWSQIYVNLQALIWICDLFFLVALARHVTRAGEASTVQMPSVVKVAVPKER